MLGGILTKLEPARRKKGSAGRIFVWGGSETYFGAALFTCEAALNSGADLVYLKAGHPSVAQAIKQRNPDIMTEDVGL